MSGQGHELRVARCRRGPLDAAALAHAAPNASRRRIEQIYGLSIPGSEVEVGDLVGDAVDAAPAAGDARPRPPTAPVQPMPADGTRAAPGIPARGKLGRRSPSHWRFDLAHGARHPRPGADRRARDRPPSCRPGWSRASTALPATWCWRRDETAHERDVIRRSTALQQAIRTQVMWNRLIAVVEEQAQALLRTAFGSVTREAGDLSAGVYDAQRPHAGAGRHRHARPRQHHGHRRAHFLDSLPGQRR